MGVRIRHECLPIGNRLVPVFSLGRQRSATHVFDRLFVDGNKAGACARFNGHIAERHATFHRKRTDRRPRKFNRAARSACRTDLADDCQSDILAGDAGAKLAFDTHEHILVLLGDERLRSKHVLHFRGANAESQSRASAVRRRVAVAAHDRHAGQRGPLFRAHNMDDALPLVHKREISGRTDALHVLVEGFDLQQCDRIGNSGESLLPTRRRRIVIGRRHNGGFAPGLASGKPQSFKGLRAGDFVHQMAVNVDGGSTVAFGGYHMFIPELVVKSF